MSRWARPKRKKKRRRFIADAFSSFRRIAIHPDASDAQVNEMRKAFFTGAAVLQGLMLKRVSPGDEITQADMEFMDSIQSEIDDFGQSLDREILGTTMKEA